MDKMGQKESMSRHIPTNTTPNTIPNSIFFLFMFSPDNYITPDNRTNHLLESSYVKFP